MSRWNWLKHREERLQSGSLDDLVADINYCRQREQLATLKSHIKTWRKRRAEAESSVIERFGEDVLSARFGSSRA
jgi:hypothetical protein